MNRTAKALLAIAAAEIGYKEKETNAKLDNPTANAGDENFTKYARDLKAAGYYQASKQGCAWCDMFVDWCFLQLCGSRSAAEEMICQTGLYGAGCEWSAKYYKQQNRFYTSDPKPGDQIFFRNYAHTGIVEKIENGVITTIEGNTSNQVARRTYKIGSASIDGYGRPKYDVEKPVETVDAFEVGDVVMFTGTKHYISPDRNLGTTCKPGKAKITKKSDDEGAPHPYHLITKSMENGGSTVYGWVDAKDIKALEDETTTETTENVCCLFLPELRNGSKGATVKALQLLLIGYGHSCGSSGADSKFGPATEAALKRYQQDTGLPVSGICDGATWKKLMGI